MENSAIKRGSTDSKIIDRWLADMGDWRGRAYSGLRDLVKLADPGIVEELKWKRPANPMGAPVYSHDGIVCTGAVLKNSVRLTFPNGASLKDTPRFFNYHLDSKTRRAIDVREGDKINEKALKGLIREAVMFNLKSKRKDA